MIVSAGLCAKMEDELKCPSCHQFYVQPVLLPCFHAMCLACAMHQQLSVSPPTTTSAPGGGGLPAIAELMAAESLLHDCSDSDKLSILSETDSGVVVSTGGSTCSRPSSFINNGAGGSSTTSSTAITVAPTATYSLCCPSCRKTVYFDENGAQNLPRYKAMQTIVDKFVEANNGPSTTAATLCQLCPEPDQSDAVVFCQQCQVFYCDRCRDSCHPSRGPLAKHNLLSPQHGRLAIRNALKSQSEKAKVKLTYLNI